MLERVALSSFLHLVKGSHRTSLPSTFPQSNMAGGAVAAGPGSEGYIQFLDPKRTWYNNKRLICLHAWIVLLYVSYYRNTVVDSA